MPVPGLDYIGISRGFRSFFQRWGATEARNFRAVFNAVVPVALVDRFRDDDEGSLFALSATSNGAPQQFSAVAFGSGRNEWELHAFNLGMARVGVTAGVITEQIHLFTPIEPYNPVVNAPLGPFVPGLITNEAFTFGSVRGFGGANTALPPIEGMLVYQGTVGPSPFAGVTIETSLAWDGPSGGSRIFGRDLQSRPTYRFDPPLRVRRDQTLAFQTLHRHTLGDPPPDSVILTASILYNERPSRAGQ